MADSPSSRALREQHTSRAAQNTIAPPAHHAQSLECTPSSKRGMTGDAVDKENARVPMTANNGMQMQVSAIPARLQHRIHKPDGSGGSAHSNPPSSSSSSSSEEPTMAQLLAQSPAHLHTRHHQGPSSSSDGAGNNNNTGLASWRKGQGFKAWESELFKSQDVRRKADVAQLYFLDYYFDLISYVGARKRRLEMFKEDASKRKLSKEALTTEWSSYCGRERALLRKRRTKLRLEAFHIIVQVGQGGYGEVYLARKKDSGEVVALKKMRKRTLAKMDEIKHVLIERDILTATKSPWLVSLLYAFQDPTYIYLCMEYVPGGDFRTLLNNSGVLKEEHARFYISEMFCSVDALHKLGYIHRDLKPENFLIDKTGHIKLTDFGLAAGNLNPGRIESMKHKLEEVKDSDVIYRSTKEMKDIYRSIRKSDPRTADSIVGSPDYMSIECMKGQSYSFSVDYWSLGCILFEFLAGYPPFSGATPEETWANLKNWHKTLRRPHYDRPEDRIFNLSDNGWSAIVHLITDAKYRMSSLDQVKAHPFYAGIPWDTLRESPAPFIPALDSEIDTGYFDNFEDPADMAKYQEVKEKQKNVDKVAEKDEPFGRGVWVGFTYKPRGKAEHEVMMQAKALADEEEEEETLQVMF